MNPACRRPTLPRPPVAASFGLAVAVLTAPVLGAFSTFGPAWQESAIVMHLSLGASPALANGCGDWGCAAERAMWEWNLFLNRSQFTVVRASTAPLSDGNRLTSVYFAGNDFDGPWDSGTLAVTMNRWTGSRMLEADVRFNETLQWDAYDGDLRRRAGTSLHDFQRVALHELGHVVGLGHPDEAGQSIPSIMNSSVSNIDSLAFDDIQGAYALYRGNISSASLPFPPRDQTFDFRAQLETKYRAQLGRPPQPSYTDVEGSVVWIQEFLRYRMSACREDQAIARVALQLFGGGVQPTCGVASATASFPARNETLAFRRELENLYRDTLGRLPMLTAVDLEGDVVWIQEYIRYRISGCTHPDAVQRVFLQIDGRGVQPACATPR